MHYQQALGETPLPDHLYTSTETRKFDFGEFVQIARGVQSFTEL